MRSNMPLKSSARTGAGMGGRSTKSEARSTKQTSNTKKKAPKHPTAPFKAFLRFVLGICFVLRASDFVLRLRFARAPTPRYTCSLFLLEGVGSAHGHGPSDQQGGGARRGAAVHPAV